MHTYYIDDNGRKDGPHDLVSIMRRIRSGKITHETLVYADEHAAAAPAGTIHDIALFFDHDAQQAAKASTSSLSLGKLLFSGWHFVIEHNVMTVYAGGLLLLSMMATMVFTSVLGTLPGLIFGWCFFFTFHNLYLVFILRIYRRQPIGSYFIGRKLSGIFATLLFTSIVLALMIAGGSLLLIIPGIAVAVMYAFVPFLMFDYRFGVVESMHASRLLLHKHKRGYLMTLSLLMLMHLACVLLIIPLPLTLPMFAAALSAVYEELSAS